MQLNIQWPLKIQSIFPCFSADTHFFHTYLPFSKPSSCNISGEEDWTGHWGGLQEIGLTGHSSSRPFTGHFASLPHKIPLQKAAPCLAAEGCQVVPQLLPRYFCTHKMMGANPKPEKWKWQSNLKAQCPSNSTLKVFSTLFLVKWWHHAMWRPVYVVKQSKERLNFN